MVSLSCQICLGNFQASQFKLFICGHGFCKPCVDQLFVREPRSIPCPTCRRPTRKIDAHPVFLEFVESKTSFANTVAEGFAKMDVDTPLDSVKRAAEKIEKGAKLSKGDGDLTARLLRSIDDFKQRIMPIFEKVQTQRQEIHTLQTRISTEAKNQLSLQQELFRLETLPDEITRLKNQLDTATRLADEATLAAEGIKDEMIALRNDRDSYRKIAADLDAEKRRIADQVDRNASNARLFREKYKGLKIEINQLKAKYAEEKKENNMQSSPQTQVQAQDYDRDYSGHEMSSTKAYTPSQDTSAFEFEGLARPGFGSDWQLHANRGYGSLSKGRPATGQPTHRRVANPFFGPLKLDRKGQPTTAVQLGPKRSCKGL